MYSKTYVLVTSARNEEKYIEKTINSVINQTTLPIRWVVVNDGSTDRTDEIVNEYERKYDFIQLLHMESGPERDFASKVYALRKGIEQLKGIEYDFLGILDADVSFESNYYESILAKYQQNPRLGIAGGVLFDICGDMFIRRIYSPWTVRGATQMFRRECYEEIGSFMPLKRGGEDTVAEVMARMHGWEVQSFPNIKGLHHKPTGSGGKNILMARFSFGLREYSYGNQPLFEVFKCIRRVKEKPYLIGSLLRMAGFIWAYCRREKRMVPDEFVKYLRREQMQRLRSELLKYLRIKE